MRYWELIYSSFIRISYEKPSSPYCVMLYFWWGCRRNYMPVSFAIKSKRDVRTDAWRIVSAMFDTAVYLVFWGYLAFAKMYSYVAVVAKWMVSQGCAKPKTHSAFVTDERFFASVDANVGVAVSWLAETLATERALVWLLSQMNPRVDLRTKVTWPCLSESWKDKHSGPFIF